MLSASLVSRTASTSMPIACPPENAYAATSSQCDTLKCRSESANRRESTGLPYAPYSNSTGASVVSTSLHSPGCGDDAHGHGSCQALRAEASTTSGPVSSD